ncbi:MAG: hypothetical protein KY453_03335 [Gemmatimonadetes bacterium]|nr:hypothetical protein [Gemmatimonadota bacterium]
MTPRPFVTVLLAATFAACGAEDDAEPAAEGAAEGTASAMEVEGGFSTPESVLHDEAADVYLVSNIRGGPLDKDGDGYVSRVSPDGEILEPRWIDGSADGVTLHAPKGMALLGDTLYVADIDCVRMFARTSGQSAGEVCIPGATFLNDIATDANDVLYVTDTGMQAGEGGFEPSGSDAIHRFSPDGRSAALAQGESLGNPNGIAFGDRGGFVVTFGSGEIYQIGADGSKTEVLPAAEGRQLDGIVFMPDGGFLFSSWGDRSVTLVAPDGSVRRILEDVEAPADIGYDATRGRVLVPLFNDDRVLIQDVAEGG